MTDDMSYGWTVDHAARRWARAVVAMLAQAEDPRTLVELGPVR